MKKLEIIIKPEKLEDLKAVLESSEVNGLNITSENQSRDRCLG